jgi:TetR/AcrR family transcriptional regulator, cholesterol catabolism regulator
MAIRNSHHFDRKLDEILRRAAAVFCARGYHQASMRDIARSTRVSLAGLYYYFSSKEHLLYLIQRHAFQTLLEAARAALRPLPDPQQRLRTFIHLHLKFFIEHPNEMKVLTHEDRSLGEEWRREVHALKKDYYQLGYRLVETLLQRHKLKGLNTRLTALALFGMMNWIYTWYNPQVDPGAPEMARQMSDLFLRGVLGGGARRAPPAPDGHALRGRNGARPRAAVRRAPAAAPRRPKAAARPTI